MEKPHRFLIDKVTSYAEEGSAFLRRRRLRSQPFARVGRPGGLIEALGASARAGARADRGGAGLLAERRRWRRPARSRPGAATEPGGPPPEAGFVGVRAAVGCPRRPRGVPEGIATG